MASEDITRAAIVRAWQAFARGKTRRADVERFAFDLEMRLERLYLDLAGGVYRHGPYRTFVRCDPKRRVIAVPSVRDQIVHHLLVQAIGPAFERRLHPHSYASRPGKGVLAAVEAVHRWIRECSDGGRVRCWSLRMDVRRYFASVDHGVLLRLLERVVGEPWLGLSRRVIESFGETFDGRRCGIPLGNLTSQLFANIYLHELDRFVSHTLHGSWYARYMDDTVLVGRDRDALAACAVQCRAFLCDVLRLEIPDEKITITSAHRGVDWLGLILFPCHRVLRPSTMRRIQDRIHHRVSGYLDDGLPYDRLRATFASYDGLLRHTHHGRERERLTLLDRCVG